MYTFHAEKYETSSFSSPLRLTAYVAKVFSMAYTLASLQRSVICDAVKFLMFNAQERNGMFLEVGRVSLSEMIVRGLISF